MKDIHHLTIISITHDMNEAAASDRILVMKNGQIINDGTPKDVFSSEINLEAPFPKN